MSVFRFTVRYLRWVQPILSECQKPMMMQMSRALIMVLCIQGAKLWHDIVTLDESEFDLTIVHEFLWRVQGQEVQNAKAISDSHRKC
jgi:hypothetical protein